MRRTQKAVLGAMVLLPVLAGIALATPGIGIIGAPCTPAERTPNC